MIEAMEPRILLSTYFVSTAGTDSNAGTVGAPFGTIQHAANLVEPGDTVMIRGGTYRETVTPAHSGTASAPITFQAYAGEHVTISGADQVSGWSSDGGKVYAANVPWTLGPGADQVFVDGRMMQEARWPTAAADVLHPAFAHAQSVSGPAGTATIYDSSLTQPDGYWNGAYIYILPGQSWVGQTAQVSSYTKGKLTFSYQDMGNLQRPVAESSYFLFGKYQSLSGAGQWYHDPTSNQTYLRTPLGDSPAAHVVEQKHRQYAFDVRGVTDIHLDGIDFFAATIETNGSSARLSINHLYADYPSHFTLQANGWSPPEAGIRLMGAGSLLENSTITNSAGDGVYVGGDWSRVTNTTVSNVDYNASDAAGIRILGSFAQVDHVTVYNCGRDGIGQYGWSSEITNNTIHDVMLETTDGGAIYTVGSLGNGSQIAYNRVYHVHSGGFGAAGIYLDNNSSNYSVHHNLVWDVDAGMKLNYNSTGDQVYNNTLDAAQFSVASNQEGSWAGTTFANNILFGGTQFGNGVALASNISPAPDSTVVGRSNSNYELGASSPAIGRAMRIGLTPARADIGALAFGAAPFESGASQILIGASAWNGGPAPAQGTPPAPQDQSSNPPPVAPAPAPAAAAPPPPATVSSTAASRRAAAALARQALRQARRAHRAPAHPVPPHHVAPVHRPPVQHPVAHPARPHHLSIPRHMAKQQKQLQRSLAA
jgi:hypothetical protein